MSTRRCVTMHGKFAAGLAACLVCLFAGAVQAASAEYYVMDNPRFYITRFLGMRM